MCADQSVSCIHYWFIVTTFTFLLHIIFYVNCNSMTVLGMRIEYCVLVNMYHVSAHGVHERMINVHNHYYNQRSVKAYNYDR